MIILRLSGGEYYSTMDAATNTVQIHEIAPRDDGREVDRIVGVFPCTDEYITQCDEFCAEHNLYSTAATERFNELVLAKRNGTNEPPSVPICGYCLNRAKLHGECRKIRSGGAFICPSETDARAMGCACFTPFKMKLIEVT